MIVVIERSVSDLPQTKDVDDGVRHGDPHASSKAPLTSSSAECAEVKKIVGESCGQVNVAPAESVKENSPDVPSVPTQDTGGGAEAASDTAETAS